MSKVQPITYCLRAKHSTSSSYYKTIEVFAPQAIDQVFEIAKLLILKFEEYSSSKKKMGKTRICLDLLTLGVYLKDRILQNWDVDFSLENLLRSFKLLKDWFIKVKYEALILVVNSWIEFFTIKLKQNPNKNYFYLLRLVVDDFQLSSSKVLYKFTPNIEQFLSLGNHENREDSEMRKYSRLEYHMSMVSAEILGEELRESFIKTKHKIVLAPPCMKTQPDDKCEAISTSFGLRCQKCTPNCRVNCLTTLGEENNFEVYIVGELGDMPEALKKKGIKLKDVGVLGIACVATLANGGRKSEYLGLPAQGVLLDYCGCFEHWNDNPEELIITNFNKKKLLEILEINKTKNKEIRS